MKSSAKKARCIYCGSDKEMTKDHVPPKLLFPEPRPNDLFTVPCCKKCNSSFSKDDEYFRGILVSCESVYYDKNASKINKKFLPSLDRSEAKGFKKTFQKSVTSVNLLSKGGIYMGKIPALLVDASRFKATAKRITKGLFYKIRGCCIPRGYQIDVNVENGYFQLSEDFFTIIEPDWRPTTSIGNGIFKYRYAPCIDNPNVMALVFWFYDKLFFHVLVSPIIKKEISQK
jgi:hypothetical protein